MAARRLIIVLIVLFAISVVAALIAPDKRSPLLGDSSATTTSTTTTTPPPQTQGESLTARIEASTSSPETVVGFVGDQLDLNVGSEQARSIEIPDFGVTDVAVAGAPASFNLLLREPGKVAIIDADTADIVGHLDVARPSADRLRNQHGRPEHKGENGQGAN